MGVIERPITELTAFGGIGATSKSVDIELGENWEDESVGHVRVSIGEKALEHLGD
jgi:hypothetical protein